MLRSQTRINQVTKSVFEVIDAWWATNFVGISEFYSVVGSWIFPCAIATCHTALIFAGGVNSQIRLQLLMENDTIVVWMGRSLVD